MKIVRFNIFETNSSSSHSLVIGKPTIPPANDFPRSTGEIFKLSEYGVCYGGDCDIAIDKLTSEVDKARKLLNIIASYLDTHDDEYEDIKWVKNDPTNNSRRTLSKILKQDPFKWFKEMLESETGISIEIKGTSMGFPFFETIYPDDESVENIVGCNWKDETSFKERMRDIVFDKEIHIIDKSIPYGMEYID